MVFGGVLREVLSLNEDTLWSGGPKGTSTPGARAALEPLRAAIRAGRYREADELAKKLQEPCTQSYLPLADFELALDPSPHAPSDYSRELDLDAAVATTRFRLGETRVTREVLASAPDQVVAVDVRAEGPDPLTLDVRLSSLVSHRVEHTPHGLLLRGRAPAQLEPDYRAVIPYLVEGDDEGHGLAFAAHVLAVPLGGSVLVTGDVLTVRDAAAVTLLFSARTSYTPVFENPRTPPKRSPSALSPTRGSLPNNRTRFSVLVTSPTTSRSSDAFMWISGAPPRPTFRPTSACGASRPRRIRIFSRFFPVRPLPAHQHQHADELLARRGHEPRRVPRAALALRHRARRKRSRNGRGELRLPRLGLAPQLPISGARRAGSALMARAIRAGPVGPCRLLGRLTTSPSTSPEHKFKTYCYFSPPRHRGEARRTVSLVER